MTRNTDTIVTPAIESAPRVYKVDAANRPVGRVASEIAGLLTGKNSVAYSRSSAPNVSVVVSGTNALHISERKRRTKEYARYTGYPGGLRKETMGRLIERKGKAEALRRAVRGMLPANKLRAPMLKRLVITK